ncbi:MAG TPA: hypothetical protein VNE41_01320 [Chitinophagaceae bacterium]|nr:hypothetical protein [Chitinophagaceae bacterium]
MKFPIFSMCSLFCLGVLYLLTPGCNFPDSSGQTNATAAPTVSWESTLDNELPLLGHRNWILLVDKAFPLENGRGIETIYTNEDMLTALRFTLQEIKASNHIKPIIYTDQELQYVQPEFAPGIVAYRNALQKLLGNIQPQVMLHDSVFTRIAAASRLFRILVLKTTDTIAYTSVYLQLGCAYWSDAAEKSLRDSMAKAAIRHPELRRKHR